MTEMIRSQPVQQPVKRAPQRTPASTTALGALTVFAPLFAIILWWASLHRIAPVTAPDGVPEAASLPLWVAALAAAFAAAGPAVIAALILANHARMRGLLRFRRGRLLIAAILALATPVALLGWAPVIYGAVIWLGLTGAIMALVASPMVLVGLALVLGLWVALTLVWFVPVTLVISGIRARLLRVFILALIWWAIYGAWLLADGYQPVTL